MFIDSYDHISFDMWLTLIKSNPEFKEKRNKMFYKDFNPNSLSLDEVSAIIKKHDVETNIMSEQLGLHINSRIIIYNILKELGHKEFTSDNFQYIDYIDEKIQILFKQNPPTLYDENTSNVIRELFHEGKSMNILSNTGFIHGKTLNEVLYQFKLSRYFEFKLYSDEIGISKPNLQAFQLIKERSSSDRILHVGDNPIADGNCSKGNTNISYFQINSNNNSIIDLLK